jgi:hypothetical protein
MKKYFILSFLLCTTMLNAQLYWFPIKNIKTNNIDTKDSTQINLFKGVKWPDGTIQITAPVPAVETDPIYSPDSSFIKTGVRGWNNSLSKNINTTDTTYWGRAETDPIYSDDSAYIKSNIRILSDTTAEWINRTIYVSMPTDPQTPGSDVDGLGTIVAPYATILKAINSIKQSIKYNAIITIQLDSGSFNYGAPEANAINSIKILSLADGALNIKGQYYTMQGYPSLSLTQDTYDKTKFTCSNYTFTTNEVQGYCISNSTYSQIAPIESNTTNVIYSLAASTLNTYITRLNTTLNIIPPGTSTNYIFSFNKITSPSGVEFRAMKINISTQGSYYMSNFRLNGTIITIANSNNCNLRVPFNGFAAMWYTQVNVNATADNHFCVFGYGELYVYYCLIKNTNVTRYLNGAFDMPNISGSNLWVSGFKSAIRATSKDAYTSGLYFLKVSNCTNIFENSTSSNYKLFMNVTALYIDNVDYFIYSRYSAINASIIFQNVYNNLNLGLFNSSSLSRDLVNPQKGTQIYFPGSYPEIQEKISSTLANNSTDSISIGQKDYNRSIEIKYNITRGTSYKTQTLRILNTGTALQLDSLASSTIGGNPGVTFNGVYYSGTATTAVIKLKWTTTNTGTAATMKWDAWRQNY